MWGVKVGIVDIALSLDNDYDNEGEENSVVDYMEFIKQNVFLGEFPFEVILESITEQFNDYMNTEDTTDYVDIFYTQLENSYKALKDDEEDHPDEKREILDKINEEFLSKIQELFNMRLTIHISALENDDISDDEPIIRKLYEFFILNAKRNFRIVIIKEILPKLGVSITDDNEFFKKIEELLLIYSPLLITVGPQKFLEYLGEDDIIEMYEDGKVNGNFCRKYSPKLYQNEEFKVSLISDIAMKYQFKQDINKGLSAE